MEQSKENFFRMLKAALHQENDISTQEIKEEVLQQVMKHQLAAIMYDYLKESGIMAQFPEMQDRLKQQTREISLQFYRMLPFLMEWNQRLHQENIKYYILKGFGLCCLYPKEAMRKMGDIDIYVPDAGDFRRVEELFQAAGYQSASKETEHHKEYYCRFHQDIIKCELHRQLVDNLRDEKIIRYIEEEMAKELQEVNTTAEVMGERFPVLPPTMNLWYLILHMLHHFMSFGVGIGPLCDITLLIEKYFEQIDWKRLEQLLTKSNMIKFGNSILFLSQTLLSKSSKMSFDADKELAWELLDDIWEYEEERGNKDRTPINLEKYTVVSYIKMCHRQMRYNYPKASGIVIFWPVLWVLTIIWVYRQLNAGDSKKMAVVMKENQRRRNLARKMLRKK